MSWYLNIKACFDNYYLYMKINHFRANNLPVVVLVCDLHHLNDFFLCAFDAVSLEDGVVFVDWQKTVTVCVRFLQNKFIKTKFNLDFLTLIWLFRMSWKPFFGDNVLLVTDAWGLELRYGSNERGSIRFWLALIAHLTWIF